METKGFLGNLVSPSFDEMIALKLLKIGYVIGYIIYGLLLLGGAIFLIAGTSDQGAFAVIGALVISVIFVPLLWVIGVVLLRIWVEFIIVFFKIEENTMTLVRQGKTKQ